MSAKGKPKGELHVARPKRGCTCHGCERARWRIGQAEAMAEAVRVAKQDGERRARRCHELGMRAPSETIGPSELLRMLGRDY